MKFLAKVAAIFDRIVDVLAILSAICIVGIMLLMCYEVIMRYFFNEGSAWAVELTEYGLFLLAFLGTAWLLRRDGHVRVDILLNRLTPRSQIILNIVTSVIGIIVCFIIGWYAGAAAWDHFQRGIPVIKTLNVPKAPFLAVLSLGCFLMSIQFLRQAYYYIINLKKPSAKVITETETVRV